MLFLILSIICSVTVGVVFKVSREYTVSHTQIITWNYVFAGILCYVSFRPDLNTVKTEAPWWLFIAIGILLPSIFLFLAASALTTALHSPTWD